MSSKQVMILAIDNSNHSFYALEWSLEHLLPPSGSLFKLVVVHARQSATSVIGLAGPGSTEILPIVEADLKRTSEEVLDRARDICKNKSVTEATFETVEGDARSVLCEAVERHKASLLVLGSHGYTAFKRAVLGSVSDHCSHHAHCSVMIVKRPKAASH